MLKSHKISNIRYTKDEGETTVRTIIPTYVPVQNIKALDISELTATERRDMEALVDEYYNDYLQAKKAATFTLEDWLHASGYLHMSTKVKWRTFKANNVEEV